MPITKVISGGQTGAERGGLFAAIGVIVEHGGWCPRGRLAEDGAIPLMYKLKETDSTGYEESTLKNVEEADATIIFIYNTLPSELEVICGYATKNNKPCLLIDLQNRDRNEIVSQIGKWAKPLKGESSTINVAGLKESSAPGIENKVFNVMWDVIAFTHDEKMDKHVWETVKVSFYSCLTCNNKRAVRILYGHPTSASLKLADEGVIELGGCISFSENRFCPLCKAKWSGDSLTEVAREEDRLVGYLVSREPEN